MSELRWRVALRHVAGILNAEELPYKVVGGASVALHAVPVETEDVDLEMPIEATYRFQSRFADAVRLPVALRESATYRSHFGRFEIDGVVFEVMGGLHRWENGAWTPSYTITEALVTLDGVPVRVSTLEEELLAYIRRGRLDRAAACLRHSDAARLVTLLRGVQKLHVL
ncbi:MAG: nucleotidyltransferase domain-containing protein [Anaerolineae bacterium]